MMKQGLLVATNGFEGNWPAIEYAAWLGNLLEQPVKLLGVIEPRQRPNIDDEAHPLESIFSRAVALFQESGVDYQLEIHEGHAEDVIPSQVCEEDCLAVISPLGRPLCDACYSDARFINLWPTSPARFFTCPEPASRQRKS
jgi:nucleotide-binding universal stress UspA family protein